MKILIREMKEADWPFVNEIYRQGIATRNATFETQIPDWIEWNEKHLKECRPVACSQNKIVGWAALSPVSKRYVYRGVAEVSLYVHEKYQGQGVGKFLLEKMVEASEKVGIWTLQASIFPENKISINLHIKCGFREVGRREKLGKLNEIWRDVVLLERRSVKAGV